MINLDLYQNIFETEDTIDRNFKVLENIHPKMKELMEAFLLNNKITLSTMDIELTSNSESLRTTINPSENPKSIDTKKDSTIGTRYYIYLNRKVNEESINFLTIELNGTLKKWKIYVKSEFFPLWNLYNENRITDLSASMSNSIRIYRNGNDNEMKEIQKQAMDTDIKDLINKNRQTPYYFGNEFTLSDIISEEEFLQNVQEVFEQLLSINEYLYSEKEQSNNANQLMKSLYIHSGPTTINLLNNEYKLVIDPAEETTVIQKTQNFHVYEQDQLIVKGRIQYSQYYRQKIPSQRISVNVTGRNHIFSPIRQLIGNGEKKWTIAKSFKTQNKDENQQRTEDALVLLQDHGLEVKDSIYTIGHYSNEEAMFKEEAEEIKKRLITAALLFAHVQNKVHLPISTPPTKDGDGDEVVYESNFLLSEIYEIIHASKLSFSKDIVRDFHLNLTALEDKHFVILSGISGTGKTQLAKLYANAVYGLDFQSENPYLSIIPVRPDWMDGSPLFGYYSSFEKQYVVPEFLKMVLQATKEREKPHFIMLDEMNLAKVEYYLSDYLSAVESQKEIPLHNREDIIDVPNKILIPPNVYIIGTINVDETTHSISDKVLDRAFVMNLSEVDFEPFWDDMKNNLPAEMEEAFLFFKSVHNILEKYDLHFGYRTMNEMLRKLVRNNELPETFSMELHEAMDVVIVEKVLPKIRGDERIESLFEELIDKVRTIGSGTRTEKELVRMKKELDRYGATQYWR